MISSQSKSCAGANSKAGDKNMRAGIHRLSEIDIENRTAVCANCGKVRISQKGKSPNGQQNWRCAKGHIALCNIRDSKRGYSYTHRYRSQLGAVCGRCGFIPEYKVQLDVHHKDGNHFNNDPSNLITLCANCHRLAKIGKLVINIITDSN